MYVGRSRDTIRDALLTAWSAEYAALTPPKTLNVTPGSWAYLLASAVAVVLEGQEAQAAQVDRDILPDQASPDALARHGYVWGIERSPGVKAALLLDVTGTLSTTVTIPANTILTYSDGTRYVATDASVALDSAGEGQIAAQAEAYGAAGTRATGDALSFVSAPTGLNTAASVDSTTTEGADPDSDEEYAAAILAQLQERPGAGNRADWAAWCSAYTALGEVQQEFVYPLYQPPSPFVAGTPGTEGVPGYVTVLVVGPAQGDSINDTRLFGLSPGSRYTGMMNYIEGAVNSSGTVITNGIQLRPVTLPIGNYSIEVPSVSTQDVVVQCTMNAANAFPFSATPAIHASSTTTSVVVTGNYSSSGTDLSSLAALVNVGTGNYRGGYYKTTLGTGVYNGGTDRTAFPVSTLPGTPSGTMYPAPPNWSAIRLAVFAFFDSLGPGDATDPDSARWPAPANTDGGFPSVVYTQALARVVMNADNGVLSATTTTPAATVTPAAKTMVTLDTFLVTA